MKDELIPFKNNTIQLKVDLITLQFKINENGEIIFLEKNLEVDTYISMSLKAFINMLITQQKKDIKIQGDVDFADKFAKTIMKSRWDIEEDLSRFVGDMAAVEITKFGNAVIRDGKKGMQNILEGLVEYYQEEKKLLISKDELNKYYSDVDEIQETFVRIESKFQELKEHN